TCVPRRLVLARRLRPGRTCRLSDRSGSLRLSRCFPPVTRTRPSPPSIPSSPPRVHLFSSGGSHSRTPWPNVAWQRSQLVSTTSPRVACLASVPTTSVPTSEACSSTLRRLTTASPARHPHRRLIRRLPRLRRLRRLRHRRRLRLRRLPRLRHLLRLRRRL